MPLNKCKGNMYDWITHTHTHLAGRCPHECVYCSIQDLQKRFSDLPYSGPLRLKEKEFAVQYGTGKTIFVENCNDLFAKEVPLEWIDRVVAHCRKWPDNTYVFQTKNPARISWTMRMFFPEKFFFGVTIETNRENDLGGAPHRADRVAAMIERHIELQKVFLTIEPIMDFDLEKFSQWIIHGIKPAFVNIGADSKGHGLPEPSFEKVMRLVDALKAAGIEVREKRNLDRLRQSEL